MIHVKNSLSNRGKLATVSIAAGMALILNLVISKFQYFHLAELIYSIIGDVSPITLLWVSYAASMGLFTIAIYFGISSTGFSTKLRSNVYIHALNLAAIFMPVIIVLVLNIGLFTAEQQLDQAYNLLFYFRNQLASLMAVLASLGFGLLLLNHWFDFSLSVQRRR